MSRAHCFPFDCFFVCVRPAFVFVCVCARGGGGGGGGGHSCASLAWRGRACASVWICVCVCARVVGWVVLARVNVCVCVGGGGDLSCRLAFLTELKGINQLIITFFLFFFKGAK